MWFLDWLFYADLWHKLPACSVGGERPHLGCRGTPVCEDHP